MLTGRHCLTFGAQHVERSDQALSGLPGLDYLVDQTPFGGEIGVVEALFVFVDQPLPGAIRILGGGAELPAATDQCSSSPAIRSPTESVLSSSPR